MSSGTASPPTEEPDIGTADEATTNVTVGEYTWADFMEEHGFEDDVEPAYRSVASESTAGLGGILGIGRDGKRVPSGEDWERVSFDPAESLGFPPDETRDQLVEAARRAARLHGGFGDWITGKSVSKERYTWEQFKWEYYYTDAGEVPRDEEGRTVPFDPETYLGFDPADVDAVLRTCSKRASTVTDLEDERTVDVLPELDEDAFFSTADGQTTLVNRYDLEKAISMAKKRHFVEEERYWVNKPYAFVSIFHSRTENEKKYYLINPYLNEIETTLVEYLSGKLRTAIKYSDDEVVVRGSDADRKAVLERETRRLLNRYDLYEPPTEADGIRERVRRFVNPAIEPDREVGQAFDEIAVRPEPAVLAEDPGRLTSYQVEKLLFVLTRNFIGYERIDGIKRDISVEDISCDGYDSPIFVYHTDYEQLITNISHGDERALDDFVVKLAQRSGKGISKRQPQVDATLPDGSRAQLTLGREVSDHGTNYTIRQFKDVPFTPIDLVNWNTFSLEAMGFLWLCIENNKSLIFAGGTASGKTTSLNAVSLFIPSNTKIVSIEDTREVELPQRNWIASVTRPSFSHDKAGNIDEFDLLEAALRQRPDYIVMGEVRGEEGRTLFQVMSTGHTTYTTFHADSVDEVLKRFTTDPINVSKTLFTALDLVSVQTQTRVRGQKVRRNKTLTEINEYDPENDEISVQDVFQWQPESDEVLQLGASAKLGDVAFDRGWSRDRLDEELFKREVILAYLITNGLNEYAQVAATIQAFINDPDTILALVATDQLEASLEDLRGMESVLIDVDPAKEAMVPRPDPDDAVREQAERILAEAEERLFEEYCTAPANTMADALSSVATADEVTATPGDGQELRTRVAAANDSRSDAPLEDAGPPSGTPALEPPPDGSAATIDEVMTATSGAPGVADDRPAGNGDSAAVQGATNDERNTDD